MQPNNSMKKRIFREYPGHGKKSLGVERDNRRSIYLAKRLIFRKKGQSHDSNTDMK